MKDTFFYSKISFKVKGILHEFDEPLVMGIINTTPDSFYSASRNKDRLSAFKAAQQMIKEGADIIDIGGYSSRPGADDISEVEELNRVLPVIEKIREKDAGILISIDTFRSKVAEKAIQHGANIINDISGGIQSPEILSIAAELKAPYIMMHMRGTPQNMKSNTNYENLMKELIHFFNVQINAAEKAGVKDIIIDPGFGFSKAIEQSFEILNHLNMFDCFGKPILVGISRKSMIYKTLGITIEDSLNGTSVLNTIAILKGASILRVHDIASAKECIRLTGKVVNH